MRNDIGTSTSAKALAAPFPLPPLGEAMEEVRLSVGDWLRRARRSRNFQLRAGFHVA